MKTRALFCAASTLFSSLASSPAPEPASRPGQNEKRQQTPFSIPNVVPKAQDTQFYTLNGQTTKFVGSTSAYLSVPTVTGTSGTNTVTTTGTARVGLFTGTPQGSTETEYSLVLAPELVDQVKEIMSSVVAKRDLELDERGLPAGLTLFGALADLLGPEIAFAAAELVPLGLIEANVGGLAVVAGAAIAMGPIVIAGAAFLGVVVNQFKLIASLHKDGGFPTAVKVPIDQFRDKKTCPSTNVKCSACSGSDLVCTAGDNARCPCDPDSQCTDKSEDEPNCNGSCNGNENNICTAGPHKDCQCQVFWAFEANPVFPNVEWLTTQQTMLDAILNGNGNHHPADNPTCSTTGANKNVNLVKTTANTRSPKDLLYIMRDTLCSDKCENLPDIPAQSVFATPDSDGCEIAISIPNGVEAWAYRGTRSTGSQWQDCYDSFESSIEKCTDYNPNQTGWVNGPNAYEFFQIGYRPKNAEGKKHRGFPDSSELPHYCPDNPKPKCDSCMGGGNNNICSQGDHNGCACEPVTGTQPPLPKVTNCASSVTASEIICCGWSKDTQKVCGQKISGCGIDANLDAICQSSINPDGSAASQTCGQFNPDDGIVKGSRQEDISTCLNDAFTLNGQWKYA